MKMFQIGAAIIILGAPSYAWSGSLEALLGMPTPTANGTVVRPINALSLPSTAPDAGAGRTAARYQSVLSKLEAGTPTANRGAGDTRIYQMASPSVVLVVTDNALGSGAVIGANGLIVTNLHVVGKADVVGVVFKPAVEGTAVTKADIRVAHVTRRDEVADLALVRVDVPPTGLTILTIGNSSDVQVGSDVHAIGHPTGEAWTYTRGIVSQIRKDYSWTAEDQAPHKANVIQTQTPINPGNSGGPLLNDDMKIIGINAFKSEGEGLNFAIAGENVQYLLGMTQDRIAYALPTPKMASAGACKWQITGEKHLTDPAGTASAIDDDCDGKPDLVLFTPDDPTQPTFLLIDSNNSGRYDIMLVSIKRDGNIDYGLFDTVGDGKFHVKGWFRPGESKPYRYEQIGG